MLFLVSGASGVGGSTAREHLTPHLDESFDAVELAHLAPPDELTVAWRQDTAELAAARAAVLRSAGRHVLLAGDPVAPAELLAAPSAPRTGGVAVCLLDASAEAQTARLAGRGDDPALLPAHLGFAQWMREHATDPLPRLAVASPAAGASPRMRWERLRILATSPGLWRVQVVDTSTRTPAEVADAVHRWVERALGDERLVMHPDHWSQAGEEPPVSRRPPQAVDPERGRWR